MYNMLCTSDVVSLAKYKCIKFLLQEVSPYRIAAIKKHFITLFQTVWLDFLEPILNSFLFQNTFLLCLTGIILQPSLGMYFFGPSYIKIISSYLFQNCHTLRFKYHSWWQVPR